MARRNAPPGPTKAKAAKKARTQKKPDEPIAVVNYRKTENDMAKLIESLNEWTQDLRAAHSAALEVPARKSRSASNTRKAVSTASRKPSYPRGNPLTESMEFKDHEGMVWLVYIEGAPLTPNEQRGRAAVLPDRHLRFDSPAESRFTSHVPAGSPFLAEVRLQSLLDNAEPDLPMAATTDSPKRALIGPVTEWSARAVESGREVIADGSRCWQETASQREALRRQLLERLSGAANTMHGMVDVVLGHRPARP
ncbi:MAG TPA: hypothetical protein VKA25_04185 [Gemmatimonadales bacterium]|nr:hypothetical protein [Gemmatimonadales bacterium]